MITLRGRELRRRGRHPRSAGRDRGARRRDGRRPGRGRARRPRRGARRRGARAALADHGVGPATTRHAARKVRRWPAAGEAQRGRRLRPAGGRGLLPARAGRSASRRASRRRRASCGSSGTCRPSAGRPRRRRWCARIARRCPEALPTRYGDFEPLQQRYDPEQPDAFAALARDDSTFWFAVAPVVRRPRAPARARTRPARPRPRLARARRRPALARGRRRPVRGRGGGARRALRRGLGRAGLGGVAQQPPLDRRRPQDARVGARPRRLAGAARASRRG